MKVNEDGNGGAFGINKIYARKYKVNLCIYFILLFLFGENVTIGCREHL